MSVFTNTFGGSSVSPADVAFAPYTFGANLTLFWPAFANGQPNVAARFMNLTATASSLQVFLPDATLVSVGYDVIIFNAGSNSFSVVSNTGAAIATIAPGQTYYILLTSNPTSSGVWQTVQFGVGTGSASAAALAGAGLLASAGTLNVNFDASIFSSSYTITTSARAILQVWTGGSGTITLPTAASVGDGFFFPIANNGSGGVSIATSGGDQIDGGSTSVFSQTQSGFVISSGSAWYTVGKGIQNTFAVTLLNLNVAGSANITETSAQAQNIIQQFTGLLTGNIAVIVPNTVQLYYIYNNTTGSFTLTLKTSAGTGVSIAQGSHSILYCDGTNVVNAFTANFPGALSLSPGSANAPNLSFIGSSSTGIYSPSTNQFAVTAGGFEVMNFISATTSVNYLQSSASATSTAVSISALGGDTNIDFLLASKGTGSVVINKADINGGSIDGTIIGAAVPAAITGTTITATSFVGPLTGNVIGNASTATALQTARTINGVSFDGTANITVTAAAGTLTGTALNSTVVSSSLTSVGTIATGTWQGTIIAGQYGGTGVNNSGKTITLGGNLATSGAFATTLTSTAATSVTLPTSGTLYGTATGSITSAQFAASLTDETGSGANVFATSPTLVTPILGVAAATSISFGGNALSTYNSAVSFTPTIQGTTTAGTGTYTSQQGFYTVIGNVCTFQIVLQWTAHNGAGNMIIAGMPFAQTNTGTYTPTIYSENLTSPANTTIQMLSNGVGTTTIAFISRVISTGVPAALALDVAAFVSISGSYFV